MRAAGVDAFGVNLFVPGAPTTDPAGLAAYLTQLETRRRRRRGGPRRGRVGRRRLRRQGRRGPGRAARRGELHLRHPGGRRRPGAAGGGLRRPAHGHDAGGGGRRAAGRDPTRCACRARRPAPTGAASTNGDRPDEDRPVRALLAAVRRRTLVPLVAAGGVGGPEDVADLLARGADLVQAGTAFLRCPESGAPAALKDALATSAAFGATEITRAFSGRRARALVNAMVREHRGAPAAYPEINNATRPLRARAARAGDPEHMSLYAGTAFGQAEAEPAADIVARLVSRRCAGEQRAPDEDDRVHAARCGGRRRTSCAALRCGRRRLGQPDAGHRRGGVRRAPPGRAVRVLRQQRGTGDDDDGHAAQEGSERQRRADGRHHAPDREARPWSDWPRPA